jgi:hypothetical protein
MRKKKIKEEGENNVEEGKGESDEKENFEKKGESD